MSAQNRKDLPLQGDRTLRSRREGSAVPAPLPSSSHDGPSVACSAGATEEIASAMIDGAMIGGSSLGKAKRPGPASKKRDAMRTSPYLAPLVERLRTSRASSPTPSIMSNDGHTIRRCVTDVEDDSSVDFDLSTMSTRKRGRPPTTGEYVGLASAKLRLVEAEKKMSDLEETKRILDPSSSLPEKIRVSTDNMIERYMEDLREAPLEDLTARAFEAMNQVIKVACVSKGLKGTLIKELKTAACKTSASLAIMASKSARSSVSAPQPAAEKSGKKSGSTAATSGKVDRDKDRSRMPPPVPLSRKDIRARKPALLLDQPSHGLRWSVGRRGRRRPSLLPWKIKEDFEGQEIFKDTCGRKQGIPTPLLNLPERRRQRTSGNLRGQRRL
ncbi:hypothetical protein PUN28_020425 [Cardiocondyla obscurior]|uniref:Uncharacterized protein n=1 Tax=Cardiocondyla obscurior TaxID=286306 RepID=A0AAW2E498_9HYME